MKAIDHEARRKQILAQTINRYIRQALPVSSEDIARDFDLSSATIRNIFVELEEAGYLTHPYTSGGRMPTGRGYRYYVDLLISHMELLDEEKERIVKGFHEIGHLEDTLAEASEVIASVTHYAGIVSLLEWQDKFFYNGIRYVLEHPEFRDSEKIRMLIRLVEEKQKLLDIINRDFSGKVKVYIGSELGSSDMEGYSLVVSSYRVKDKPLGRLAVLGPVRMEYRQIIPTVEYISDCLSDMLSEG